MYHTSLKGRPLPRRSTAMKLLTTLNLSHFDQMFQMEQQFYGSDHITPAEEAFAWYQRFPYTVVAAEDHGRIAGFVNLFPVCDAVLNQLRQGTFNDRDLTVDQIVDIHASQTEPLHMFLSCDVIASEYRKHGLTNLLLRKATEQYAAVEHRCDVIVTDNVPPEGCRFAQTYGFVPLRSSDHDSLLQEQSYRRFCSLVRAHIFL